MRIWIDIANAPHVTFFRPIARRLEEQGHELVITVYDRGLTADVARLVWPDATVIGSSFRKSLIRKATAVTERARDLRAHVRGKVDAAVSHNSYSQIVAARSLRLRTITAMDYEHQPANHLAFRLAHRVFLPEAIRPEAVRKFGLRPRRIVHYPGLKEDIALADFVPNTGFRATLGVGATDPLVVVRPAPSGAAYHRGDNPLFDDVLQTLQGYGAPIILSPRTRSQGEAYASLDNVRVLTEPVDGPDLLYAADLFVGAGGTMTREAAVLGTKTFSVFAGKPAAVDQYLVDRSRLLRLTSADALPTSVAHVAKSRAGSGEAADRFVALLLASLAGDR